MANDKLAQGRGVYGAKRAVTAGLLITALLTLASVNMAMVSLANAAENNKALTLCVSWKGEPEPPVRFRINQRPASWEFTAEQAAAQYEEHDKLVYGDWIPDYYLKIEPPSKIQNCVGTLLETILGIKGKYNASSDDFYKQVLRSFAVEVEERSDLQRHDIVCWINDEHCGHVGYVASPDTGIVITKDGNQATYSHWIFEWEDTARSSLLPYEDPLVKHYGKPRFFRMPVDELRINVSEPGDPCRGEVPDLIGMTREEAEEAIREVGLEPDGEEGDLLPLTEMERETVYEQSQEAGSMLDDGELVQYKWYPPAPGFQPGDGAKVDSRFTSAEVTKGSVPAANLEQLGKWSAGPRSAINFSTFPDGGASPAQRGEPSSTWMSKKFSSPEGARKAIAEIMNIWKTVKSSTWQGGFFRSRSSLDPKNCVLQITSKLPATQSTRKMNIISFSRITLYREQFIISYTLQLPTLEHDFSAEEQAILKRSRELINLRFPLRK